MHAVMKYKAPEKALTHEIVDLRVPTPAQQFCATSEPRRVLVSHTGGVTKQYELSRALGSGSYGKVFKSYSRSKGGAVEVVAVKEIGVSYEHDLCPQLLVREVSILRSIDHPCVVKLLDVVCDIPRPTKRASDSIDPGLIQTCWDRDRDAKMMTIPATNGGSEVGNAGGGFGEEDEVVVLEKADDDDRSNADFKSYLVLEYMPMDLREFLKSRRPQLVRGVEFFRIAYQLLDAVQFLHDEKAVLHRDLKPRNVLFDPQSWRIKISDFGLSRSVAMYPRAGIQMTLEVVTRWYRCPEIAMGVFRYGIGVDLWALGAMLGEIYMGEPFFPGTSELDTLFMIFQLLGSPGSEQWPEAKAYKMPHNKASVFPQWSFSDAACLERIRAALMRATPHATVDATELFTVARIVFDLMRLSPNKRCRAKQVVAYIPNTSRIESSSPVCLR